MTGIQQKFDTTWDVVACHCSGHLGGLVVGNEGVFCPMEKQHGSVT